MFVVVEWTTFVSSLMARTVVPGTTADVASVISPLIVAFEVWAYADEKQIRIIAKSDRSGANSNFTAGVSPFLGDNTPYTNGSREFLPQHLERELYRFSDASMGGWAELSNKRTAAACRRVFSCQSSVLP